MFPATSLVWYPSDFTLLQSIQHWLHWQEVACFTCSDTVVDYYDALALYERL